jgi:hypothetical protein
MSGRVLGAGNRKISEPSRAPQTTRFCESSVAPAPARPTGRPSKKSFGPEQATSASATAHGARAAPHAPFRDRERML